MYTKSLVKVPPIQSNTVAPIARQPSAELRSASVFSTGSHRSTRIKLEAEASVGSKIKDFLKLVLVIFPPLLALIAVSWLLLNQATGTMDEANYLARQIRTSELTSKLIARLQKERGISCVYLSSEK